MCVCSKSHIFVYIWQHMLRLRWLQHVIVWVRYEGKTCWSSLLSHLLDLGHLSIGLSKTCKVLLQARLICLLLSDLEISLINGYCITENTVINLGAQLLCQQKCIQPQDLFKKNLMSQCKGLMPMIGPVFFAI